MKVWQLTDPRIDTGYILLDEAQDTSPAVEYVLNLQRDHAQLVLVGGSAQQIYGWRGARDTMSDCDGAHLTLTQSFRFGPAPRHRSQPLALSHAHRCVFAATRRPRPGWRRGTLRRGPVPHQRRGHGRSSPPDGGRSARRHGRWGRRSAESGHRCPRPQERPGNPASRALSLPDPGARYGTTPRTTPQGQTCSPG
ncbi:UvrD-helicase domain-containing protein [Streptomyces sp. NPDC058086]|uniref:UvrD-helicase domain-containing protein n=1 Tax=Streptomyces sp. NPDC058086 TaxID=3346334 RepID=UPI0036E34E25